jgi:CDP-glycerol glycerophosphotransferase (TagB/SpsB family)
MSEDDPALNADIPHLHSEFIGSGNKAFAKMNFLKADIVLSTTPGLDVFQWKRSKDVKCYVHLPHGTGIAEYEMFGIDFYDAILLGAEHQEKNVRELEKLRSESDKELYYIGVPYWDTMRNRIRSSTVPSNKETTVLLSPSWGARSNLLKKYGDLVVDQLLETGYKVVIRPHPQSYKSEKELLERFKNKYGDKVEWNSDPDNFEILMRADVMISEYSGVVYDYACVFDKPVICLQTERDYSTYDMCWLQEDQTWSVKSLPEVGEILTPDNIGDLKSLIDKCLTSDDYGSRRKKLCDETWFYQGEGAKRTADYIIEKYNSLCID